MRKSTVWIFIIAALILLCLFLLSCKNANPHGPDIEKIIKPPDPPVDPPDTPALVASLTASDDYGEAPLWVTFTGNATGGTAPYTYHWDFGNGYLSDVQNPPAEEYGRFGTYVVVLTVTDSASVQATDSVEIYTYEDHWIKVGVTGTTDRMKTWHASLYLNGELFSSSSSLPMGANGNYQTWYYKQDHLYPEVVHTVTVVFAYWDLFDPTVPDNTYFRLKVVVENPGYAMIEINPVEQETPWFQWNPGDIREFNFIITEMRH